MIGRANRRTPKHNMSAPPSKLILHKGTTVWNAWVDLIVVRRRIRHQHSWAPAGPTLVWAPKVYALERFFKAQPDWKFSGKLSNLSPSWSRIFRVLHSRDSIVAKWHWHCPNVSFGSDTKNWSSGFQAHCSHLLKALHYKDKPTMSTTIWQQNSLGLNQGWFRIGCPEQPLEPRNESHPCAFRPPKAGSSPSHCCQPGLSQNAVGNMGVQWVPHTPRVQEKDWTRVHDDSAKPLHSKAMLISTQPGSCGRIWNRPISSPAVSFRTPTKRAMH